MRYAKILNGLPVAFFTRAQPIPVSEIKFENGLPMVRPVIEGSVPEYDPETEYLQDTVTVTDTAVLISWTAVAYTAEALYARNREKALRELHESDLGMCRVVEDLLTLLITTGTITVQDLPDSVVQKLQAREALRSVL